MTSSDRMVQPPGPGPSRRTFLKRISAAALLGVVGQAPGRLLWASSADDLIAEPDVALLREVAARAVEAARSAGAGFADVRVTAGRQIAMGCTIQPTGAAVPQMGLPRLSVRAAYGIRAIVDGAWGFAGSSDLAPDAVGRAANIAVARARANRPRRPRTLELAPVPPNATGEWEVPIERDPFGVPIGEQADLALAALEQVNRVAGVNFAYLNLRWTRNTRVFASSEGAVIVQRIAVAAPNGGAGVSPSATSTGGAASVEGMPRGPHGYEAITRVDLGEELVSAAERAVEEAGRPLPPPVEVGRYDLVFSAPAVGPLLVTTLAAALDAERVLGYHANNEGTSFAAPPDQILGRYQVGSPLLTIRADRSRPGGAATVGWDDEGVKTGEQTLVREGIVTGYLTNRQTAAEIGGVSPSGGEPVRSGGCASGGGQRLPSVTTPNLTMLPAAGSTSVDDLIAGTKRGFYIEGGGASSDQQVLNTQGWVPPQSVRRIRDGRLGERVRYFAFQTITPQFWRSVDAIGGDDAAVHEVQVVGRVNDPLEVPFASIRTVPVRVREVNVLNTGTDLRTVRVRAQ